MESDEYFEGKVSTYFTIHDNKKQCFLNIFFQGTDHAFIVFRETKGEENQKSWSENWRCSSIPVVELLASTAGIFLAIIIGAVVTLIVLVNLRDLREWKQFVADKKTSEMRFSTMNSPLYIAATTEVRMPKFEDTPQLM